MVRLSSIQMAFEYRTSWEFRSPLYLSKLNESTKAQECLNLNFGLNLRPKHTTSKILFSGQHLLHERDYPVPENCSRVLRCVARVQGQHWSHGRSGSRRSLHHCSSQRPVQVLNQFSLLIGSTLACGSRVPWFKSWWGRKNFLFHF